LKNAEIDLLGGKINIPNRAGGTYFLVNRGIAGESAVVNVLGGTIQVAGGGLPATGGINGLAVNWCQSSTAQNATITIGGGGQILTPSITVKLNNGGNGGRITLNQAWALLEKLEGVSIAPLYGPPRAGDVRDSQADTTLAVRDLGHAPRYSFEEGMRILGDRVDIRPEGYAVDRRFPQILYVPQTAEFNVREGTISWQQNGQPRQVTIRVGETYVLPMGYRLRLEKQLTGAAWRLVGARADGTLCHKPSTVSGGGKSEISKSISNVLLKGPVFLRDYHKDMAEVAEILKILATGAGGISRM